MTTPSRGPIPPLPDGPDDRVDDHSLGARLQQGAGPLDLAVENLFDRVRGHPTLDRLFYEASEMGDFSLMWHLIGAVRALRRDDPLLDAVRTSSLLGAESLVVNQGIKRLFRRERPVHQDPRPHRLRTPLTSSFPSGHASAAFLAAVVLADGSRAKPLYYGLAFVVASSRVYVRIHHPSDVVAGAALGYGLGRVAVRIWPRQPRRESPRRSGG